MYPKASIAGSAELTKAIPLNIGTCFLLLAHWALGPRQNRIFVQGVAHQQDPVLVF